MTSSTYKLELEQSDYVTTQMFISDSMRKSLLSYKATWWLMALLWFVLSVHFNIENDIKNAIFFLILAIFWAFMPSVRKWAVRKSIHRLLSDVFGIQSSVTIEDDQISTWNETGFETKMPLDCIVSMNELRDHFIVVLKGAQTLILPKRQIEDQDQLRTTLKAIAEKTGLELEDYTKRKFG